MMIDRRSFCTGLVAGAALAGFPAAALAADPVAFRMWHSLGCGCCLEWARRMEAAFGRKLEIVETGDIAAVKRARGVPQDLASCHTAELGRLTLEGHVPPADVKRLLAARNSPFTGLAVPGMPAGSPGMDVGHDRRDPLQTIAFGGGRRAVFARHG